MANDQLVGDAVNTLARQSATLSLQEPSPFLDLALELRLKILEYALPPVGQEYHVCEVSEHTSHAIKEKESYRDQHALKRCPGILLVNHQIYTESLEFIRGVKGFIFCTLPCMRIFLQNSNKEHVHEISKLSCKHFTTPNTAQQHDPAYTQLAPGFREHPQHRLTYFVDQVKSTVSHHMKGECWERKLVFKASGSPMSLTIKWTLSLWKMSASVVEPKQANNEIAHFVLAGGDEDVAAVPVTDHNEMMAYHSYMRAALKAYLGTLPPDVLSIIPPFVQGYPLS